MVAILYFQVPDEVRAAPGRPEPEKMFNTLIKVRNFY